MQLAILNILFILITSITSCSSVPPPNASVKPLLRQPTPTTSFLPEIQPSEKETMAVPYVIPSKTAPLIIIDPGHGGKDYGHSEGLVNEKQLNLTTSRFLKNYLVQFGFRVIMTRVNDQFPSLEDRYLLANENKAKIFVSIHYNSAPNITAEGIEIFYSQETTDKLRGAKSKQLAESVLHQLIKRTHAKSRGVKHGNHLAVIRHTNMPAILIEGGFMTNRVEFEKIKKLSYQKTLALSIATGIQNYFNQ